MKPAVFCICSLIGEMELFNNGSKLFITARNRVKSVPFRYLSSFLYSKFLWDVSVILNPFDLEHIQGSRKINDAN